ncbi:hypothetical protein Pst134EA_021173 [Puccinia striiformis f. sp. tritici]|uniref:hypothetical protein n=1 Tax=Puccinia striiformis f. sp. tritici TaxID=168172 RepID=UPI0020079E52|nr:hypothetical protein Pst134EA_021173 [Puccinia striiformis f. sp. tritici]KAH9457288.1 hypothetical protein Pst134EA_021173 [Puccinia striiformis f. sp. tritici]
MSYAQNYQSPPPPGYQQNYGPPAGNSGGPPPAQGYPNNQYGPGAGGQPNYQNGPPNGAGGWSLPPRGPPPSAEPPLPNGWRKEWSVQTTARFSIYPPSWPTPSGAPGTAPPPTNDQKTAERDGPNFPGGPPGPAMNNYGAATAPPSNGNWGAPPNSYGPPQGTPAPGGNLAFGGQNPADRNGSNGYSAPPNPSAPPANNWGPPTNNYGPPPGHPQSNNYGPPVNNFPAPPNSYGAPPSGAAPAPGGYGQQGGNAPVGGYAVPPQRGPSTNPMQPTGNAPPDAAAAAKKKGMLGAGLGVLGGLALGAFANHEWHEHERHEEERQEEAYEAGIHDALRF